MEAAGVGVRSTLVYIYTVISAADIFQFETNMALAVVASERVDASSIEGADGSARSAFIDIYADSATRGQAEPRGWTQAPWPFSRVLAAVLAVRHGARP